MHDSGEQILEGLSGQRDWLLCSSGGQTDDAIPEKQMSA